MKKKIRFMLLILIGIFLGIADSYAASNPYPYCGGVNCTYYAWQRAKDKLGVELPGWNDAWTWKNAAINAGYAVDNTASVDSIVVWPSNPNYSYNGNSYAQGHVAYVESVSGSTMCISESNWAGKAYNEACMSVNETRNYGQPSFIHLGRTLPSYIPGGSVQDIGTAFLAYITQIDNVNLAVGATEFKQAGNVTLQTKGSSATKWKFLRQSDGSYFIQNQANTDYYLDVSNDGNANGDNVYVWTNHGGSKMRWYVYDYNWYYRLVPKSANEGRWGLDVADGKIQNGQNMQLWEAQNDSNRAQTLKIEKILFRPSGNYVDIGTDFVASIIPKSNSSLAVGTTEYKQAGNVTLQNKGTNATKWKFLRQSDGSYFIQNQANTNYYLDVSGNGNVNGNNVYVWTNHGNSKMRWYIYSYNGGYRLVSKSGYEDRLALDIKDNNVSNGANIEIYEALKNDNNAQTFNIVKDNTINSLSINTPMTKLGVGASMTAEAIIDGEWDSTCSWSTGDSSIFSVSNENKKVAYVDAKKAGQTILMLKCGKKAVAKTITIVDPYVTYQTQVQNKGWLSVVRSGATSGTVGSGLRMEALKVNLEDKYTGGNIEYRSHIQNLGWESTWKKNGEMSGTSGKALRLEAIQMRLTGTLSNYYDIYYRVHVQNLGWLGWAKNGAQAGSQGYGYRLEAIEIKLIRKGVSAPGSTTNSFSINATPSVVYRTQIQNLGWESTWRKNGAMSGTSGKGLKLETLQAKLQSYVYSGGIEYRSHIQNLGWESTWKKNGESSGTVGKNLRLEAVQMRLTGEISKYYDIYYRVHVQNLGWLGWAKNGAQAGSQGYAYRLEAIEIQLVKKRGSAPTSEKSPFMKK